MSFKERLNLIVLLIPALTIIVAVGIPFLRDKIQTIIPLGFAIDCFFVFATIKSKKNKNEIIELIKTKYGENIEEKYKESLYAANYILIIGILCLIDSIFYFFSN